MLKKSFRIAVIFGFGALVGKGLYSLLNPSPSSVPLWVQLAIPSIGCFLGSFLVTVIIKFLRSRVINN